MAQGHETATIATCLEMACVIQLSCKYIFSYYCRAEQDSGKSGTIQRKATRSRWSTRRSKVDKYLVEQCIPTTHVYPRIVFKPMKMKNRLRSASVEDTAELSPEYKQIVDFVTHGWSSVKLEMEQGNNKQRSAKATIDSWLFAEDTSVKYYQEKSNPQLADFSPFDLDAWWGRRLYQNLTTGLWPHHAETGRRHRSVHAAGRKLGL